jgi:hypothetical protein
MAGWVGGVGPGERHGEAVRAGQRLGAHTGRGDRPAQQRGVDLAPGQAGGAVLYAPQFQRHVRVLLHPGAQQADGEFAEGRPGVPEPERPHPQPGRVEGSVGGGHGGGGPDPEGVPGRGQAEMMRGAVDQADAEMIFKLAQRPRHHGLVRCRRVAARVSVPSSAIARKQRM